MNAKPAAALEPDHEEILEWIEAFDEVIDQEGPGQGTRLLDALTRRARQNGVDVPVQVTTHARPASVIAALVLGSMLNFPLLDPLFGAAIGIWIVYSALRLARLSLFQLMDHELADDEREKIRGIAQSHPEVVAAHDLRTRVAGPTAFIQIHLEMDGGLSLSRAHEISDEVEAELRAAYPNSEVIIHHADLDTVWGLGEADMDVLGVLPFERPELGGECAGRIVAVVSGSPSPRPRSTRHDHPAVSHLLTHGSQWGMTVGRCERAFARFRRAWSVVLTTTLAP